MEAVRDECIEAIKSAIQPFWVENGGLSVHGVSTFFIHRNYLEDATYVFLGKEHGGLYNLPGGCCAASEQDMDIHGAAVAFYDGILDSVGLILTKDVFSNSFCSIFLGDFHDEKTGMDKTVAIFVLAVVGLERDHWIHEYRARIASFEFFDVPKSAADWQKYVRWDDVDQFRMDDGLSTREDVSPLVKDNWQSALRLYDAMYRFDAECRICDWMAVRGRPRGQLVLSKYTVL